MNTNYFVLILLTIPFKFIVFYTILRLSGLVLINFFNLSNFLIILGLSSMIYGALGMFFQFNIRKFLAYSAINHSGYIVVSLATGTYYGFTASLTYIVIYLLTTLGFLFIVSLICHKQTGKSIIYFSELSGICFSQKLLFFCLSLILLSMAGIPPLGGFWAKFFVLKSVLSLNSLYFSLFTLLIILVTTSIAVVGYLRIIKLFFYQSVKNNKYSFEIYPKFALRLIFFICFILLGSIIFFLFPVFSYFKILYYVWLVW
jgi:NADH-quinone oxidoreductase subunit N